MKIDLKEYWEDRGRKIKKIGNEYFYTVTELKFYIYRRERLLKLFDELDLKGKKILDYGCGDGFYSSYFCEKGACVTGVDISAEMIDFARNNLKNNNAKIYFYQTDGKNLEFEDDHFDIIISTLVLQHVLDKKALSHLFNEFSRTLKEDGELIHFDRVKEDPHIGSTIKYRNKSEYIHTAKEQEFKLVFNKIISSPTYDLVMKPYYLIKLIALKMGMDLHKNNKLEQRFSKIAVSLTKIMDKWWQNDKMGHGFFVYKKS